MPLRLRRLLSAFAFFAIALALPPATVSSPALAEADARPSALAGEIRPERPRNVPEHFTIGERAATLAVRMVGTPYRWGGESPGGFDCSGLVRWAYGQVGLDLPHNSHALYGVGREVSRSRMQTGDVLFFSGLGHVGMYLGGGRMVHAPYSGKHVEVVNLRASHYGGRLVGARRVVSG
jgi:peptidoglycan DL-endopeptidase CwlO